jgi:uncharacterized delta-60 repeat protein
MGRLFPRWITSVAVAAMLLIVGAAAGHAQGTFINNLEVGYAPETYGPVDVVCPQPDGKILIFQRFNGSGRTDLARLNANGTYDPTLIAAAGGFDGLVRAAALQPDGKILVVGDFGNVQGTPRSRVARLHANGILDTSFAIGSGADANVHAVVYDPFHRKVVIGGEFTSFNGEPRGSLAQLNPDGSLDGTVFTGPGANGPVYTLLLDQRPTMFAGIFADGGGLYVGGDFTTFNGQPQHRLAKFTPTPERAPAFPSAYTSTVGPDGAVRALAMVVTPASSFLWVGGDFLNFGSTTRSHLAEVFPSNGALTTVVPPQPNGTVHSIALYNAPQENLNPAHTSMSVAGSFTTIQGQATPNHSWFLLDQQRVASFFLSPGVTGAVSGTAVQSDGKVLLVGEFSAVGTTPQARLARFGWISAPSAPTIRGSGPGAAGINIITWPRVNYVSGYVVERSTNSSTGWGVVATINSATATSHIDTQSVSGSVIYYYRVWAFNSTFASSASVFRPAFPSGFSPPVGPGSVDSSFRTAMGTGFDDPVAAIQPLPDGRVLVAGLFTSFSGVPRMRLARLHADGSLDTAFDPGAGPNAPVRTINTRADGKAIVGGDFTAVAGEARSGLARVNADGTLDTTFVTSPGFSGRVIATTLAPDGKILAAGWFSYAGQIAPLTKLNSDGSVDPAFTPALPLGSEVFDVTLQSDGKILAAGSMPGQTGPTLWRLHPDGSADSSFLYASSTNSWIRCVRVTTEDRILITGSFGITMLNADGSPYSSFNPSNTFDYEGHALAIQADGRILVAGTLQAIGSRPRLRVTRLTPTGGFDSTFLPGAGANDAVDAVALSPDGKILLGGRFTAFGGQQHGYFARLRTDSGTSAPSAPTGVIPSAQSSTALTVSWAATPFVLGYRVFYRLSSNDAWIEVADLPSTNTSYTISGFLPGTTMEVSVLSYSTNGTSAQSAAVAGRTWMPFESWKVSYGLAADADPSTPVGPDGVPLMIEYALGMNPTEPDRQKLPQPITVNEAGTAYAAIKFTQSKGAPDVSLTAGASENLASWDYRPEATVLVSRADDPGGLTETVVLRDAAPAPPAGGRFLRLRAVSAP